MSKLFSESPIFINSFNEFNEKSLIYMKHQKYKFLCPYCKKEIIKNSSSIKNNQELICWSCNNKKSLKEKYGVENISQLKEIKEKKKETTRKHFGVDYPMQSKDVMKKSQETNMIKYGGKCPNCDEKIKEKRKELNIKKYGTSCPANKDPSINVKSRQTMIEKYGTISVKRNFIYNEIIFDSSWELYFYIYMSEIKNFKVIRNPKFIEYEFENKKYKYFPDFEIDGKFYEIKGDHLLEKMKIENTRENAKYKCMIENKIEILTEEKLKPIFQFIDSKFGKDYIKKFKNDLK